MRPEFSELLDDIKMLHAKKAADYSKENDPFSNFKFAAAFAENFIDPIDKTFATIIGIKLARLIELQSRKATNEPVIDTRKDLSVYFLLWYWYHSSK